MYGLMSIAFLAMFLALLHLQWVCAPCLLTFPWNWNPFRWKTWSLVDLKKKKYFRLDFHKYNGTAFPYSLFILGGSTSSPVQGHLRLWDAVSKRKHGEGENGEWMRWEEGRGVPYNPAAVCKSPCNNVSSRIFLRLYGGNSFLILKVPAMRLRCSSPGLSFPLQPLGKPCWPLTISPWSALLPPSWSRVPLSPVLFSLYDLNLFFCLCACLWWGGQVVWVLCDFFWEFCSYLRHGLR